MDWFEIIEKIITFILGGGLAGLGFWGIQKKQKKNELKISEIDVRKLQDVELRERAAQLVNDLSEANETIKRISGELQRMINDQAEKDIRIAYLEAENKKLKEKSCKKWCTCLNFDKYEDNM